MKKNTVGKEKEYHDESDGDGDKLRKRPEEGELEEEKEELKEYQEKDKDRRCLEYALYQRELEDVTEALEDLECTVLFKLLVLDEGIGGIGSLFGRDQMRHLLQVKKVEGVLFAIC